MGSTSIMLAANDLHLLRVYAQSARLQICPLVTQDQSVSMTSTGEKLMPSHVNKIITEALGGSASQIRKALAGRVSDFYFSHIYIYFLYS